MRPEHLRTLRILWGALLASTVMFLGVAVVVVGQRPEPLTPEALMLPVLGVAALGAAVVSVVLPRMQLVQGLRRLNLEVAERASEDRMFSDSSRRPQVFANPEQAIQRGAVAFQTAMILGMALSESVALMGFVAIFLGFPVLAGVPFFLVAWIVMLTKFPSEAHVVRALQQAYDADLE